MQCPPELSQRAVALKPSLTLEISATAKALQNDGRDICSLSAGEPDFNTPEFITEAAREALANGITRYGPAAGDPELREAIAEKRRADISEKMRLDQKAAEAEAWRISEAARKDKEYLDSLPEWKRTVVLRKREQKAAGGAG